MLLCKKLYILLNINEKLSRGKKKRDRLSTFARCLGFTSEDNKFLTKQKQEQYIAE
jgi:hypothetical protein